MSVRGVQIVLEVVAGPHFGQRWALDRAVRLTIGRQAPAQLRFALEVAMSTQHCELVIDPPRVTLRDLSSTNGTLVNEVPVAEAVLMDGDQFGVGQTRIRVAIAAIDHVAGAVEPPRNASDQTMVLSADEFESRLVRVASPEIRDSTSPPRVNDLAGPGESDPRHSPPSLLPQPVASTSGEKYEETIDFHPGRDPNPASRDVAFSADSVMRQVAGGDRLVPEFCGPYQLLEQVGEGGMAVVFRASHRKTGQEVAIKLIRTASVSSQKLMQLFVREASVLLRLKHPRIVRSIEFGFQDQQPYLVLEWLPVIDLLALIDPLAKAPKIRLSCWSVSRVLQALQYAHDEGFVHRDVKPSNILAYRQGYRLQVKLGDFGLAKCFDDAGLTAMTDEYSMRGTLAYMSPEQMRDSRSVGPKSDIFSAGACLYRLLTGRHPKLTGRGVEAEPDVLAGANLPESLTSVLDHCMQTAPERRPDSAAALAAMLQPFHGKS